MLPKQIDMGPAVSRSGKPRFEQVFHKDHRYCDCEMPMVSKKWNDALGVMVNIRLCCLAKAVEELTGKSLYEVYEFDPKWEWDCDELHECPSLDGTVELRHRGQPPDWLLKRMKERGVPVHNLPE